MKRKRVCKVRGCNEHHKGRGYCKRHYERWVRGSNLHAKGNARRGDHDAFLAKAMASDTNECIIWPFGRSSNGYACQSRTKSKPGYVHRWVCILTHGEPPEGPVMHAAHSCGNGHLGCINWKHLHWATPAENAADKVRHGTYLTGERVPQSKLTGDQVLEIRSLRGTMPAKQIAEAYGISPKYVYQISTAAKRRIWRHLEQPEMRPES